MATSAAIDFGFYASETEQAKSRYSVSCLDLRDLEDLNLYVRSKVIRAAFEAMRDEPNDSVRAEVIRQASLAAAEISFLNPETKHYFQPVENLAYMLYLSVGKKQQGFTHEAAFKIFSDNRNVQELSFAFRHIRGETSPQIKENAEAKIDAANPITS